LPQTLGAGVPASTRQDQNLAERARAHYEGLDLLRGVAAAVVVLFHVSARLDLGGWFNHGYLAVDFFFALSGFVLDRAYAGRLAQRVLSFKAFFLLRAVRLLPMVAFGTVISGLADLFRSGDFPMSEHLLDIAVAAVFSCMLLPTFWKTTLEDSAYPLNGPVWSLFFEFVANLSYVFFVRAKHSNVLIVAFALVSGALLASAAIDASSVNFGALTTDFYLGFPRVFWSFFVGVLLSRTHLRVRALPIWLYAVVLTCMLACPALPNSLNVVFDLVAICVVSPLIVLGAAHCEESARVTEVAKFSGDMSYPLYAMHYPFVRAIGVVGRRLEAPQPANLLIASLATVLLVLIASRVFASYDVPVRKWLNRRLHGRRTRFATPGPASSVFRD
jgi:peptidoglycan/LPS O-acetylase OafA/YrhL